MTATVDRSVDEAPSGGKVPLVELKNIGKSYGNITALKGISLRVHAGEVTGILGDNGAGKSTLIKIISGLHQQTDGELLVDGEPTKFGSPKEALGKGIATVYQNLAVVPLMPVWRNFFLGPGDPQEVLPVLVGRQRDAGHHALGAVQDGHRSARRRRADRFALGWSAPVRGDRAGGVLRGAGADSRRAHRRAGCQAVRGGAQVHHRGQRRRFRCGVHHPQSASCAHGRRSLRAAQPRSSRNWTAPTTRSTWNTSPRKWPAATNSRHCHTNSRGKGA